MGAVAFQGVTIRVWGLGFRVHFSEWFFGVILGLRV